MRIIEKLRKKIIEKEIEKEIEKMIEKMIENKKEKKIFEKLIELDKEFEFGLMEKDDRFREKCDPIWNFYFTLHNLSINFTINLKWLKWGWFFLSELSKELDLLEDYDWADIINEDFLDKNLLNINKRTRSILIDNKVVENIDKWEPDLLELYTENTKICMSLRLNLKDYLILTNLLTPGLFQVQHKYWCETDKIWKNTDSK